MLNSFNKSLGTKQGRIKPSSIVPYAGEYVFCLGHEDANVFEPISPGDFALVEQHAAFTGGTKLLRLRVKLRPPQIIPIGYKWLFEILVNDEVWISQRLVPGGPARDRRFALNVSKLPAIKHYVTLRIRYVEDSLVQHIAMASYECGPPMDQSSLAFGISSGALFGNPSIGQPPIVPSSISTGATLPSPKLNLQIAASGIASPSAPFGTPAVANAIQSLAPSSIASAYASGTAATSRKIAPGGISTGYASGTPAAVKHINGLTLQGWWRGSYGGSPWIGTASAGGSSGRNISGGDPPTVGTAQNGFTPADYNNSTNVLAGTTMSTYMSTTAWTIVVLAFVDTVDVGGGGEGELISDDVGTLCLGTYNSSGNKVFAQHYDTGWRGGGQGAGGSEVAITLGAYQAIQARYNGTNIQIRVNGGSFSSSAASAVTSLGGNMRVGASRAGFGRFFDGRIMEVIVTNSSLSDAVLDEIRSYFNWRYNLSV